MNWKELQDNHHIVLHGGVITLLNSPNVQKPKETSTQVGNYLIYNQEQLLYVGQGINIKTRLSTHWKNKDFAIHGENLSFKEMPNAIGRKEFEEYVMCNLKPEYNKSHKGRIFSLSEDTEEAAVLLWQQSQTLAEKLLNEGLIETIEASETKWQGNNQQGVYLVRRNKELIYVGETHNFNERIGSHHGRTRMSALRRSIGRIIFGFDLKTQAELGNLISKDAAKKYFTEEEDGFVNQFISECEFTVYPVSIGRLELEATLIQRFSPFLNNQGNKA